jgi:hypothetical protein
MLIRSTLFAGIALLAASAAVQAQTATAAVNVNIPSLLVISSSGSFTFPAADGSHYDTGYIESTSGPTLSHRANVPYRITLEAQSGSMFTFTADPGRSDPDPNKSVTDLSIFADFDGSPTSAVVGANASPNDFYTRAARGPAQQSELTARMNLDWTNDPPGTYSTTILFTMIAQ